jgi:hypothetical protein
MAGISQQVSPDQVLPLLAYNVYTLGFEDNRQTEFLRLLARYVEQARQLQELAGSGGVIHIGGCSDAGPLLDVLGYRVRGDCGQRDSVLVTYNPERAFLTSDSGFPLTSLEDALAKNSSFSYPYPSSTVPVLLSAQDWTSVAVWKRSRGETPLDALLHDSNLARLYWAFSRVDPETQRSLRSSPGLKRLVAYGAVLDFYGGEIAIRSGRVQVPGGSDAETAWRELVGASPRSPGEFVLRLVEKDHGWLATYYDVLSRVSRAQQAHLTAAPRLKQLYEALRAGGGSESAAAASFRKAPLALVLFTRLQWDSNGEPYVPGDLATWQKILTDRSGTDLSRDWAKRARHLDNSEELLEALVGLCKMEIDNAALQIYLTTSEIDRARSPGKRLAPATVLLLASHFNQLGSWEPLFAEFPSLNDASIRAFINTADSVDHISDAALRANSLGIFQANLGLWEILARQQEIPGSRLNDSWQAVISPFAKISSSAELYDAGSGALSQLSQAAGGPHNPSEDQVIDLLAGPPQQSPDGRSIHSEIAAQIRSVLAGQRLVSLDTILPLGDGLRQMARGGPPRTELLPLAEELREFQMPQPIFTRSEKSQWAPGVYDNRHVDVQTRTDLTRLVKTSQSSAKLDEGRGQLTLYLRDTLVGLNYAYYEPPGAEVLHNNPLFVRSHDFTGETMAGSTYQPYWHPAQLTNTGTPAGGGAYLLGSLSELPYALATTEQDFLAPHNIQALVWKEVAPALLVSATLPRWWNVTPNELHAVALYQIAGEEILRAASGNPELMGKAAAILAERMTPQQLDKIESGLRSGQVDEVLSEITPADTFYLTAGFRRDYPAEAGSWGPKGAELDKLAKQSPDEVSLSRISHDFGVPHPVLTMSLTPELLDTQPFPAFEGDSSRLFAESWESNNLYWARLVDERGEPPVVLNQIVPILTREMVTNIFASQFEDWQAVLRAMRQTGEQFREGKLALSPVPTNTTQLR